MTTHSHEPRRPLHALALAAALALPVALAPLPAAGASRADAFEDKIPPVSGYLFLKSGRFEVTPTANLSLNDAFFDKYLFGAKATYHINEYFTAGATFATGLTSPTNSAVVCPGNEGCRDASDAQLFQLPGKITMMGGLEGGFSPVYGKLNVFGEWVLHFDLSAIVGVDYIAYQSVLARNDSGSTQGAETVAAAGGEPDTESTIGGHVGLGMRVFFTEFIAARLEVKDYIYTVTIGNFRDVTGNSPSDIQNQIFAEIGLSIFFPFTFTEPN
jgi:outer membrane beta-barrel protein